MLRTLFFIAKEKNLKITLSLNIACLLLLFFGLSSKTYTQSLTDFFQNYQVENGLPSNNVYAIETDSSGFLWIATDSGLCRYDGQYFKTYTKRENLPDIEILDLYLDSKNRLWCNAFNGKVFCIENGKVRRFENLEFPQNRPGSFWTSISESLDGTIYLHNEELLFALKKDSLVVENKEDIRAVGRSGYFMLGENHHIVKYNYENNIAESFSYKNKSSEISVTNDFAFFWNESELYGFKENGTESFRLSLSRHEISSEILRVSYLDESIWINSTAKGLYEIKISEQDTVINQYLKDNSITKTIRDDFGNYWISTFGKGIFKYNTNAGIVYDRLSGLEHQDITTFTLSDEKLMLGDAFSNVYVVNNDSIETIGYASNKTKGQNRIVKIIEGLDNQLFILTDTELLAYDLDDKFLTQVRVNAYKGAHQLNNDSIITLSSRQVGVLQIENLEILDSVSMHRPSCMVPKGSQGLWLGTANGLFYSYKKDPLNFMPYEAIVKERINDLDVHKEMTCVCTANNGFYLISDDTLLHISKEDGLVSDHCNAIVLENHSSIWYATNTGLNKITFNDHKISAIELMDVNTGLISNQIKKIEIASEKLYMATPLGLQIIERFNQRKIAEPITYIDKIQVNNQDFLVDDNDFLLLDRDQNNISFYYSAIDFLSSPVYEIQLIGYDDDLKIGKTRNRSYYNLGPGNYNFKVRALNQSLGQKEFAQINLQIKPYFWEQKWVKALFALIVLIASIFLFVNYRVARKRRQKLFQLKTEAELKALRAQINPHFLFNALNSIQDVILDKDIVKANSYISKFSKLMRLILDHSKTPYISLAEEISMLELYLSLEKLRFETDFEARIIVDPSISKTNTILPSAILQPLVENAIWHGLLRKKTAALLSIEFEDDENLTKCTIDDNGIGINISERNVLHNSSSLVNMKERITLINQNLDNKITFKILDSKVGTDEYPGTRIEIYIPKEIQLLR